MQRLNQNIIEWFTSRFTACRHISYTVGATLVVLGWIFWPAINGDSYVRVPGGGFELHVDSLPKEITIRPKSEQLKLKHTSLTFISDSNTIPDVAIHPKIKEDGTSISFNLKKQVLKLGNKIPHNNITGVVVKLQFQRMPFIDLISVDIEDRTVNKTELSHMIKNPPGKVLYVTLLREQIADILVVTNDNFANIALGFLIVLLLWLFTEFAGTGFGLLVAGRKRANDHIQKMIHANGFSIKEAFDECESAYWEHERWLSLWKVVGPSAGFILTVTSLAAALHPSVQATQDAYQFISGIQIAVVSTFIGLAIRLMAHFQLAFRQAEYRHQYGILQEKLVTKELESE